MTEQFSYGGTPPGQVGSPAYVLGGPMPGQIHLTPPHFFLIPVKVQGPAF